MKQTPFLVHASLLDKIVLFDKNYDAERLKYSLEVSGLEELFEEGSEKMIMEQGKNISGGQGQRIILARAIYKDFDLLLLDEPFSELDGESVEKIMSYLQAMAQFGKIIILISHNRQLSHYGHQVIDLDNRQVAGGLTFK
jgi:ABC-type transport system involved in cytochrome bd biosynthesis fused ATPase/permease subunit